MSKENWARKLIDRWPSREVMAKDLKNRDARVTPLMVRLWYHRQSIPVQHFPEVVTAAENRGFRDITLESLHVAASAAKMAARRRKHQGTINGRAKGRRS